MDSDHYIEKCIHGRVFRQCRCAGQKAERVIECWHDACVVPNLRSQTATLTRERDELRELVVWAARYSPSDEAVEEALRRAKEGRGDGVR